MLAINYDKPRYVLSRLFSVYNAPARADPCSLDSTIESFVGASEHLRVILPAVDKKDYCLTLFFQTPLSLYSEMVAK